MLTKLPKELIESKLNFIKNYISADNAADGSLVDPNANVTRKTVAWKINKCVEKYELQCWWLQSVNKKTRNPTSCECRVVGKPILF